MEKIPGSSINRRQTLQLLSTFCTIPILAKILGLSVSEDKSPQPSYTNPSETSKPVFETKEQLYDYLNLQQMVDCYDISQYITDHCSPELMSKLKQWLTDTTDPYVITSITNTLWFHYYQSLAPHQQQLLVEYSQGLTSYMGDSAKKHIWMISSEARDTVSMRDQECGNHQSSFAQSPVPAEKILTAYEEEGYTDIQGNNKLHRNHATSILNEHYIRLQSSQAGYEELGNIDRRGYTCAEGVKKHTVEGIITLKQHLDTLYSDTGVWYVSGLTEPGHALGIRNPSHGNGDKVDLTSKGISALALHHYLQTYATHNGNYYLFHLGNYRYIVRFHNAHNGYHFDVEIQ